MVIPFLAAGMILQDQSTKTLVTEWTDYLTTISHIESVSSFVPVNVTAAPPKGTPTKGGASHMRLLAILTRSDWVDIGGVQCFIKRHPRDIAEESDKWNRLVELLKKLSPGDIESMAKGEFSTSSLDQDKSLALLDAIGFSSTLAEGFFKNRTNTRIGLKLVPAVRFVNPKTGRQETKDLFPSESSQLEPPDPLTSDAPTQPVSPRTTGALDFGDGKLLTLKDILKEAHDTLKVDLVVDDRAMNDYYFVSGGFDADAFRQIVKRVVSIGEPSDPVSKTVDRQAVVDGLLASILSLLTGPFDAAHGGFPTDLLLKRSRISGKELLQVSPEFKAWGEQRGFDVSSMSFTLEPQIAMQVAAPGYVPITDADPLTGRGSSKSGLRFTMTLH